jgi:hypothetical protein
VERAAAGKFVIIFVTSCVFLFRFKSTAPVSIQDALLFGGTSGGRYVETDWRLQHAFLCFMDAKKRAHLQHSIHGCIRTHILTFNFSFSHSGDYVITQTAAADITSLLPTAFVTIRADTAVFDELKVYYRSKEGAGIPTTSLPLTNSGRGITCRFNHASRF